MQPTVNISNKKWENSKPYKSYKKYPAFTHSTEQEVLTELTQERKNIQIGKGQIIHDILLYLKNKRPLYLVDDIQ